MTFQFTRLGKIDAGIIARLQFESWRNSYRSVLPDDYVDGAMEEDLKKVWSDWRDEMLVIGAISEDGGLAGFATYVMKDPVYIDNFHVDVVYHGSGLAVDLFIAGAREIAGKGASRMWLTVLDTNERARAFYAKLGGQERPAQDDEMLGHKVRSIPVHWHDLLAVQKIHR